MAWVPAAATLLLALRGAAGQDGDGDGPSECFTVNGADYRGAQSRTGPGGGGRPCLFWNQTRAPMGGGAAAGGGLGPHNHCRNPDGDARPWCYVAEGEEGAEWKYCDIPSCRMPGFVGCFVDSGSPPALSGASGTSTRLTVPLCLRFCRGRGYEFAGLEAGYACFCGHAGDLRRGQRAGTAECDQVCFGKASQLCGGDGRLAVYHAWVGACRANSSAPSGVIYSPGFPDDYGPDADCAWRLGAGAGAALEVTFRLFDIRDPNDRLTLRDARSRRLLAQFDGRRPPPPARALLLPTEALELTFRSDTLRHAQGFALTYRRVAVPPSAPSPTATPSPTAPHGTRAGLSYAAAGAFLLGLLLLLARRLRRRPRPLPPLKGRGPPCGCLGEGQPWVVSYRPHGRPTAPHGRPTAHEDEDEEEAAGGGGAWGHGAAAAALGERPRAPALQPLRAGRVPAGLLGGGLPAEPLLPAQRAGQHLQPRRAAGGLRAAGAGGAAAGAGRGVVAGGGALRGAGAAAAGQRAVPPLHEPPPRAAPLPPPPRRRRGRRGRRQRAGSRAHHLLLAALPALAPHRRAGRLRPAVPAGAAQRRHRRLQRPAPRLLRRPGPVPPAGAGAAGRGAGGRRAGGAGLLRPHGRAGAAGGRRQRRPRARALEPRALRLLGQQPPADARAGGAGAAAPALGRGSGPAVGGAQPVPRPMRSRRAPPRPATPRHAPPRRPTGARAAAG